MNSADRAAFRKRLQQGEPQGVPLKFDPAPAKTNGTALTVASEPTAPRFSEESLALEFSAVHGDNLRYVAKWAKWLGWDGMRWQQDSTLHVYDLTRDICRDKSHECGENEKSTAVRLAARSTSAAVEALCRSDRRHAATVDQWDRDPWALNTPAGTLNLQTGEMRPTARNDYCTKITGAAPGGDCPLWSRFIHRITNGDESLRNFLQRIAGYALTGVTREHALFFMFGTGANGKSVLLSAITGILGDYARTAPIEAFIASSTDHHPCDLAGLQGARLVTSVETEDGRRWAESKLKALTGGDRIAARFMRQDFFEFVPQFKLLIAGNHKPSLRTVDEAMRRRFNLIPFTVTIPATERDAELSEKLRAEWGGILRWAIDGCLAWQREGLRPSEAVRNATAEYLAAEDSLGRWLDERCITDLRYWTASNALFADWKQWTQEAGEREGTQKRFSQELEGRGFRPDRTRTARGFRGIGLRTDSVTRVT